MFRGDANLVKIHILDYVEEWGYLSNIFASLKRKYPGRQTIQQMKADVTEPMNQIFIERESKEDAVKKRFWKKEVGYRKCSSYKSMYVSSKLDVSNLYKLVYR